MTFQVYGAKTGDYLFELETEPNHGEDRCEVCRRCLHCHGNEPCDDGESHVAIKLDDERHTDTREW